MKYSRILIAIALLSFFCRCSPEVEIPSYIWIDSVDFQVTNAALHGTASHKITDVRVFANGKSLGRYQIPARIPILESGATRLSIHAGIMLGGVPQMRATYSFYTPYILDVDLKKGKIDTLIPYFTYTDDTKIWEGIEDFESAGSLYIAHGKSAPLKQTSDESLIFHFPKEINNSSGLIELPYYNDTLGETIYHFEIRTIKPVELTNQNVYDCLMELNFRITHNVEIGMIIHSANSSIADYREPVANLRGYDSISNKENVWKKVYANFTTKIRDNPQMKNFDVYIRATISTTDKARFLFDNIKIVYSKQQNNE